MKKKLVLLSLLLTIAFTGCGTTTTSGNNGTNVEAPGNTNVGNNTENNANTENSNNENNNNNTENNSAESDSAISVLDLPKPERPIPEESLIRTFADHDMKVGTCLSPNMISNPLTSELILDQFNSITLENAMKPDSILNKDKSQKSGKLVVTFGKDMIKMLDWAKENDMAVRGHTIVWYSQTPAWIFHEDFKQSKPLVGREEMLNRLDSYMQQVFSLLDEYGYSDMFYAYDVANEAWMEDGSMRQNNWLDTIGEDYLWQAFYYADKYAPEHIDLYYNDYNEQFKTDTLVKFVDTLKDDTGRSLIDGIGLQAHLYTQDSLEDYLECVETLGTTGLKVQLTELDVCLGAYQNPLPATEQNLVEQSHFYYELINGILALADEGKIKTDALTFWGFSDGMSWRREYSPLLYDENMKPKYAYYAALQDQDQAGY